MDGLVDSGRNSIIYYTTERNIFYSPIYDSLFNISDPVVNELALPCLSSMALIQASWTLRITQPEGEKRAPTLGAGVSFWDIRLDKVIQGIHSAWNQLYELNYATE